MIQAIAVARRIGIDLEDGSVQPLGRDFVHDDRDSLGLESMAFVRRILLDRDPESAPAAAEDVTHDQHGAAEVRLTGESPRRVRADRQRRGGSRHGSAHWKAATSAKLARFPGEFLYVFTALVTMSVTVIVYSTSESAP